VRRERVTKSEMRRKMKENGRGWKRENEREREQLLKHK